MHTESDLTSIYTPSTALQTAAVASVDSSLGTMDQRLRDLLATFDMDPSAHMDLPMDDEDELDEAAHLQHKARGARRNSPELQAERMATCQKYMHRRESEGSLESFRYQCQLKICPSCGALRGLKLKTRIADVVKKAPLLQVGYYIAPDESSAKAILEFVGGMQNYLRIPQQDGTELIFIANADLAASFPEVTRLPDEASLAAINWTVIQNTADDRNASGTLGKKVVVADKDENTFNYGTPSYYVEDEHTAALKAIEDDVLLATFTMDPHNKDQFIHMMRKRDLLLREAMTTANIPYKRITTYIKVNLSYIDWYAAIYDRCQYWLLTGKLSAARWNAFWNSLDQDRQKEIVAKAYERRMSRPIPEDL